MTKCDICSIIENRAGFKFIYEDEQCFAILHESPAALGHSLVIPKKHATILEELDEPIVEHIFAVANKISTAVFETLGAHGTNIIMNNGHGAGQELPHVILNVLPRKENDNINLEWPIKKAQDNELKRVQSMMKNISEYVFSGRDKQVEEKAMHDEHKTAYAKNENDENYLVKGLKRMP